MKRSYDTAFKPVTHTELSSFGCEIVSAIKDFTKENILHDIAVEVDGRTFRCHKFILASCSLFFRDYFRSWVGSENRLVTLSSFSAQTFETILQMICSGQSALTMENVMNVWEAAHFLQIKFLVIDCERFAEGQVTLETLEMIYRHAKLFDAVNVLKSVYTFVKKNFEAVCKSEAFVALAFDDLYEIIKSNKLLVTSEDVVLRSLFRWALHHGQAKSVNVSGGTNEGSDLDRKRVKDCNSTFDSCENCKQLENRSAYLSRLLKISRYFLASLVCLKELHSNSLAESDLEVKNILFEAVSYQQLGNKHGYWPSSACYRESSGMVHVGVCVDKHIIRAWDLRSNSWLFLPLCFRLELERNKSATTVFNDELYILVNAFDDKGTYLYVLKHNNFRCHWRPMLGLGQTPPGGDFIMVSSGDHIYFFDRLTGQVYFLNPKKDLVHPEELRTPNLINIQHAFCYEDIILVFCSPRKTSVQETQVHLLRVATKKFSRCENIPGPAKHMVSFRADSGYYVMQRDGSLWQVTLGGKQQSPTFTFIKKLWSFIDIPRGAFVFNAKLYVVGKNSKYTGCDEGVDGVFKKIVYRRRLHCSSNFAHCVLPKGCISDMSF